MTTYDDCVYENFHPVQFSLRLPGGRSPALQAPEGLAVRLWGSTIPWVKLALEMEYTY